ncbi:MAG: hypothetical protein LBQ01_04925 [Prevotellaceae bacterium]|jgi:hypothetical protein|nr:hypothetical protein [Prevotellaceae bacterium]
MRLNLNGKVKFITEIYFLPAVSGDTIKRGERTTNATSFFESAGDEPFSSYETKVYFDHNGNIAECFMDDSASDFHFKETFEYDDNLLVTKQGFLSGEFFYKEIYRYDSKNRETERYFYDSEKHLFESVITKYPDANTVIEKVHTENEYSDFERETRLKDGLPVLLTSRLDSVRIIEKWRGEYDGNGRVSVSKFYDSQDKLLQYEKYVYDGYGNELEYAIFSDNDELLTKHECRYKYDGYGNWTQQVTITDGQPEIIILRNIIYY